MECLPRENAPPHIQWIYAIFGSCVYGYRDAISILLGYASILCWLNAQVPQMIENHKLGSADGLSLYLLYFWLAGDLGNMFSCVLNNQLPFQIYLAAYFVCTDIILLFQYFYFRKGDGTLLCSENALKLDNNEEEAGGEDDEFYNEESRLLMPSDNASLARGMTETITNGLNNSNTSSSYGSTAAATTTITTKTLFMGLILFGLKVGSTTQPLTSSSIGSSRITAAGVPESWISTMNTKQQYAVSLGWILAWTCTTFYLLSRVPQIHKNYKRRSTQGLSLALFSFAVSGNITYALSILFHPGHTIQSLMDSLPYLAGSLGTLFLDSIIFGQFMYYRNKYNNRSSTDATTTSLNRVLTHQ